MIGQAILSKLNAPTREERLENLREAVGDAQFPPMVDAYINNHIHTTYSFSPYSPAASVYAARAEGLRTAGIVDHDSIAGAREFIEAQGGYLALENREEGGGRVTLYFVVHSKLHTDCTASGRCGDGTAYRDNL